MRARLGYDVAEVRRMPWWKRRLYEDGLLADEERHAAEMEMARVGVNALAHIAIELGWQPPQPADDPGEGDGLDELGVREEITTFGRG